MLACSPLFDMNKGHPLEALRETFDIKANYEVKRYCSKPLNTSPCHKQPRHFNVSTAEQDSDSPAGSSNIHTKGFDVGDSRVLIGLGK